MREKRIYADGGAFSGGGQPVDWLDEGYYKVRLHGGGPWVPCYVTLEDGERDPDTWELLSDQWLSAIWHPRTDSPEAFPIDPRRLFNRATRISREEYQWLISLRTIPRLSQLP